MGIGLRRQPLRWFYLWLLIGWGLICWVSYQSLISNPIQTQALLYGDKLGHFLAYFTLMAWFSQLYARYGHVYILVMFIVLGVVLEFLQGMTAYRFFEYSDMLANSLGAIVAFCLASPRYSLNSALFRCECWLLSR